jgi:pyruvate/2-oxoglutarate dehydrogenase complex dihydrolipoamide dehydrogenase (E3) component
MIESPERDPVAALMPPPDEHNRRLVENVHPASWTNPEPASRYHLVVIGAGTAGLVTAAGAAGLGARVALIERHLMGGDCLNVGCVPSKGLIRAARAWHAARSGARFGAPVATGDGDFGLAMARMRRLRADLSRHDSARRFAELGVDVFLGEGRFVSADAVEVGGKRLRFRRGVVATGGRPTAPPIAGLETATYLTNETVFSLTELPRRLAVIGGGPIGCELAQAFARFGSRVIVLDIADRILLKEDRDAAELVRRALERDGVELHLGVRIEEVHREGGESRLRFSRDGEERRVAADAILVAAGRAPNVGGLGLEAAGIAYDQKGVKVDERLRTTNHRVYAAGDVAADHKFTHVADAQARLVIENALFFGRKKASDLVIPWCTFTSPEVAHVGLSEEQGRQAGHEVETLTIPLAQVDRAVLDGEEEGFLRLHLEKGKDRLLGATLVAEHAGDMIAELALAITAGTGLGAIGRTIHPYPTQAEAARKAADAWRREKLTPRIKKLFGWYFRILG